MAILLFSRWRPVAILDFDTRQKWRYGTLGTAHVYHHTKFGDNSSNGGRVIAILSFQNRRHGTLWTVHVYNIAKFGDNVSNGGRVIAIFRFFKMAAAAILDFVGLYFRTTHEIYLMM